MKTEYTPGPWNYGGGMLTDDRGNIIASRHSGLHRDKAAGYGDIRPVEADANAQLISAAPDLLLACVALLATTLKVDDKAWADAVVRAGTCRPCDLAAQAIAKATGSPLTH